MVSFSVNFVLKKTAFVVDNTRQSQIFTVLVKSRSRWETRLVLLSRRLPRFALLSGHVLSKPHPSPFFATPFLPHTNFLLLSLQFTLLLFPEDVRHYIGKKMVLGPYSFWRSSDDCTTVSQYFSNLVALNWFLIVNPHKCWLFDDCCLASKLSLVFRSSQR